MEKYRWFYNSAVTITYLDFLRKGEKIEDVYKISYFTLRDEIIAKYRYTEEVKGNFLIQDYIYDENSNRLTEPEWMGKTNKRVQRGAIQKLSQNINSCLSNKREGNISHFHLNHQSKKNIVESVHFEDERFPTFIRDIESRYWFKPNNRGRKSISFEEIFQSTKKRGLEIVHDKLSDVYTLHYPVDIDYFPNEDRRADNQGRFNQRGERIISLDPGVRKFMLGYDPTGKYVVFGQGARDELTALLHLIDKETDKSHAHFLWARVKNLVSELHWKTITYLISNYDTIILPDFRISGMVKVKNMNKMVKRLLQIFSFFSFKTKLAWKCKVHKKKLVIVDESYTSKTCGSCGKLNDVGKSETYSCRCGFVIDRDVNGSRNIMIKNVTLIR